MFDSGNILETITPDDRGDAASPSGSGTGMGNNKDIIQTVGKLLSESQRQLLSRLSDVCYESAQKSNGIWLQDVLLCETPILADNLVRKLEGYIKGYGRSILFITRHDSHVHINHDCAYSGGSCRCYWRKEVQKKEDCQFRRRLLRSGGRRRIRNLDISDWQRILLYFTTEGRRTFAPYINGQVSKVYYILFLYINCYNNI